MLRLIAFTALALASTLVHAAPTVNDIHRLIDELHYTVDNTNPSQQDLATLEASLRADIELLNNRRPRLLCLRAQNGRYYPTNSTTGAIIGDDA